MVPLPSAAPQVSEETGAGACGHIIYHSTVFEQEPPRVDEAAG